MQLTRELRRRNRLGHAVDALARAYLVDSLPPSPDSTAATATATAATLRETTRLRLCAPRCARLVDEEATGGRLEAWDEWGEEDGELGAVAAQARAATTTT